MARCTDFYPRSPCGERLEMARAQFAISEISIHALLAESDLVVIIFWCSTMQFLSTLSLRRATTAIHVIQGGVDISIHALLAESDRAQVRCWQLDRYFYPRSPCGERPLTTCKYACKPEFLSTLSLRRATSPHRPAPASVRISIHALLAESDRARRYKVHNQSKETA